MNISELGRMYELGKDEDVISDAYRQLMDPNNEEIMGEMGLIAAKNADPRSMKLLLDKGLDPNLTDMFSRTLLHQVAQSEWRFYKPKKGDITAIVEVLLAHNTSVLRKDSNKMVCYHYAARTGNYEFVEALAKHNMKLNIVDSDGNTGIHLAADAVRHKISSLGYATDEFDRTKNRIEEDIKERLARGWDMDTVKKYMKNNRMPTVEEHEQKYRDLEEEVDNFFKVVVIFAENGVDVDEKNRFGNSALDFAIKSNAKKIATYLSGKLDRGADAISAGGMTLHQAIEKNDLEAVKSLLRLGADVNGFSDPNSDDFEGCTPLGVSCGFIKSDMAIVLLENGADPNLKDSRGNVAVSYILSPNIRSGINHNTFKNNDIPRILNAMIDAGLRINDPVNEDSDTILTLACKSGRGTAHNGQSPKKVILEELLRKNVDVNIVNRFRESALMLSCLRDFDVMENIQIQLLERGADTSVADNDSNTALHYAAMNDSSTGAKILSEMLLDFGTDPAAVNNQRKTALDIATERNNEPLVKLLLSKM